jgi:hypothetical protein
MGLDMTVFVKNDTKKIEPIAYWRKTPSVHEWFRQLGISKGIQDCKDPENFNGIKVPITEKDMTQLIDDLCNKNMDYTISGFFFGSDEELDDLNFSYYMAHNFEQITKILLELKKGSELYYTSSW